jgi:hypothetical protein
VKDGEKGSRGSRPIPSPSMVRRRRRRHGINECHSMCVPTTISLASMPRTSRVAIGLSDYRGRVMVARTIVLRSQPTPERYEFAREPPPPV